MFIQKLPWAGIRIESEGTGIVIDPLFHFPAKFGQSHEPLFPLTQFGSTDAVLITHHHGDHFDPEAIALFYGADIPVYLPMESLAHASGTRLKNVNGVSVGDSVKIGPLTATASFSVDGVGDPQISWIVRGEGKQLIHCGDTLWHGYWWKIKAAYGPMDVVCLPVNGAVVEFPGMTPSGQPIVMSPEQAVAAASVLEAKIMIPIHYKAVHHPPIYRETPDLLNRLKISANGRVELSILQSKESIDI